MSKRGPRPVSWLLVAGLVCAVLSASVLAIIVVGPSWLFRPLATSTILPGFEGLNAGVHGFQPQDDRTYRIDEALPDGYEWISDTPSVATVRREHRIYDLFVNEYGQVRAEISWPEPEAEPFTQPQKVEYWIEVDENHTKHVIGEVLQYRIYLSIESLDDSGRYTWSGEKVWFDLASVTWNKASLDPDAEDAVMGRAWEAPLAIFLDKVEIEDPCILTGCAYDKIDPSAEGRWMTLYSEAVALGTVSDLGFNGGEGNVNNTLSNELAPDNRMSKVAFFNMQFDEWGCFIDAFGFLRACPAINLELKVYTLLLGQYIYTNPEKVDWEEREGTRVDPIQDFADALNETFGLPATILGVIIFILIVLFIIGVFFIMFVFVASRLRVKPGQAREWGRAATGKKPEERT